MDGFETLTVALAQLAPVWLDRQRTTDKVCDAISEAAARGAALVAFGEAFLPGYPFWLERTGGAAFNSPDQKNMYRHYLQQAVSIADGDLTPVCRQAAQHGISVILGTAERPVDRGGHSIYPSEIEDALATHPAVAEVAVVGRKHPEWGEIVVAFVVPVPGYEMDPAALDAHCVESIARFKKPKEYRQIAELPKNNYGKVLKTDLRDILAKE